MAVTENTLGDSNRYAKFVQVGCNSVAGCMEAMPFRQSLVVLPGMILLDDRRSGT